MKLIFAQYEHSTIGFPGIVLKWHVEQGRVATDAYVTVGGIVEKGGWVWHNPNPAPFIDYELSRFDDWVRRNYAENKSVQG